MLTTYDQIFQSFIDNCGIDVFRLPTEDSKKYDMIRNGTKHYNTFIPDDDITYGITGDDLTETVDKELDGTRLLIYAYCLKYVYLENQLVGFEELWTPFQREVGIKNYSSQVKGRENTLERVNHKIIEYITLLEDQSIM